MAYLFQRIVHNDSQWQGPTPGRLGNGVDGGYLDATGFGHEDWQFNTDDTWGDGWIRGYSYYVPAEIDEVYNILFATYASGAGWLLRGWYRNSKFVGDGLSMPDLVAERRARQLIALRRNRSLGPQFEGWGATRLREYLKRESFIYHWSVSPEDVCLLSHGLSVSTRFNNIEGISVGAYFTRPA